KKARPSFVCPNFFAHNIFAKAKTTKISNWPKKFPEDRHRSCKNSPKNWAWLSSLRSLRNGERASFTTRPRSLTRMASFSEISQDAHSGRSTVSREILFHAGRSWFSSVGDEARQNRRLHLLGPMVSGSGA